MKTLTTIIALVLCLNVSAQDSLRILRLEQAVSYMAKETRASQKVFTTSIGFLAAGGTCFIIASSMSGQATETGTVKPQQGRDAWLYAGVGLSAIGTILNVHARFKLGRAGNVHLTPTGVTIQLE